MLMRLRSWVSPTQAWFRYASLCSGGSASAASKIASSLRGSGEADVDFGSFSIEGSIDNMSGCGSWFCSLRFRSELLVQFLIRWEQGGPVLPNRPGILGAAGLLVLVAEPGIAFRKLRLRRLGLLLLNESLEMLDDLVALVELRRPVGYRHGLGEAFLPIRR